MAAVIRLKHKTVKGPVNPKQYAARIVATVRIPITLGKATMEPVIHAGVLSANKCFGGKV